jgi:hypothetical protein
MPTAKAPARKPTLAEVLGVLEKIAGSPMSAERAEDPLLDHLLVGVLGRHAGQEKARQGIRALSEAFLDFNEVRSSPLFEIEEILKPFVPPGTTRKAAWDVRMALQDVFDGTHGLDLEPLRSREPEDQRVFLKDLPNTPGGPGTLVFQLALGEDRLALGPRERHLLERLGMLPRASDAKRVRAAVERMVPASARAHFTWVTGATAHLFEKGELPPDEPFVQLLVACRAKELAEREKEKKREELRQKAEEKQRQVDEARRLKVEEAERKKREVEEGKKAAQKAKEDAAKKRVVEAEKKRKEAEEKKKAAKKAKEDAAKKKAAEQKKAAEHKKAAEQKRAAEQKKAAAKKAAAKKPPPKKKR